MKASATGGYEFFCAFPQKFQCEPWGLRFNLGALDTLMEFYRKCIKKCLNDWGVSRWENGAFVNGNKTRSTWNHCKNSSQVWFLHSTVFAKAIVSFVELWENKVNVGGVCGWNILRSIVIWLSYIFIHERFINWCLIIHESLINCENKTFQCNINYN